ncbi:DUF1028 domain-containing protein [Acidimangrovimonas pyrenivorans]|uniref:DUF1028 domain-containing protein n=1 Tax=Acidimangrovimonas pyrenivorans TaxID=2030798 RepID=A0ABV7AER8_9RHOB
MTFSILARDPKTGAIGGAAATGSLCVGGWVLRGDIRAGMSASQGAAPSTFWGEDVLGLMRDGVSAAEAVARVVAPDQGRDWRQLSALDLNGGTGVHTGKRNTPVMAEYAFETGIAAGNMLASDRVPAAIAEGFLGAQGDFAGRLLDALFAGRAAGSDSRGLMSAALLVLREDAAPLTLRIDYSEDPLADLRALLSRATSGDYGDWARQVPTMKAPQRVLDE